MLLLALQPCRHRHRSCRHHQCLFHRPPPSPTLVAVTITITLFIAITIARPPPLPLLAAVAIASLPSATTITVEYSAKLEGWVPAVHDGDTVIIEVTPGGPTDEVRVKLKRSSLADEGTIFARRKVVVAP